MQRVAVCRVHESSVRGEGCRVAVSRVQGGVKHVRGEGCRAAVGSLCTVQKSSV